MSATVAPDRSGPGADYWAALDENRLIFQRCRSCGGAQLPPRHECTACLAAELDWEQASGRAKLVSWVVYHRAYHPVMEAELPYVVAVVELAEGPRMIANLPGSGDGLEIDMELTFQPIQRFGQTIAGFRPAGPG